MDVAVVTVTVVTSGTPVVFPDPPQGYGPSMIYVSSQEANTADGYIGVQGMSFATGAGVIQKLDAGVGWWSTSVPGGSNARFNAKSFYVDAKASGQKFNVTYYCQ